MKPNHIWVVEMQDGKKWLPCTGVGLDREQGRDELRRWKNDCPEWKFQLRKYMAMEGR